MRRVVSYQCRRQIAVQAGEVAGRNALRLLRGDTLDRARLSHRGWVLDLGGFRGLAEFGPVTLSAPFLDLVSGRCCTGRSMSST